MKIEELYQIICERRDHPTPDSYTAHLFNKGQDEIIKKVGEEAIEVLLAAKGQGNQRLIEETADLTYHVLVLLSAFDIKPAAVEEELENRHRLKTKG